MNQDVFLINKITRTKKMVAWMFVVSIFTTSFVFVTPQKVYAQIAVAETNPFLIGAEIDTAIAADIIAANTTVVSTKEGFWDAVAFGVVKIFLNRLTLNIVEWIRTGYDGKPTFLTNTDAFLRDIGNQATGVFISEMGLNEVLCEPWRFGATFGLTFQKPYLLKAKCTLLDAQANFQRMSENFMAAGWPGFLDITVKQENNPYGAFLQAKGELAVRIGKEEEKQKFDLGLGRGFFSVTKKGECVSSGPDGMCDRYAPDKIVTPGSYIAESMNFIGMSSVRQAEYADEINESLSVIAGEMIMQAINPNRGLAGFDTVTVEAASAAFANQTSGRLQDVAKRKINEVTAAKNKKEASLTLIQTSIYPIYIGLIGVSDASPDDSGFTLAADNLVGNNSCLDRLLAAAEAANNTADVNTIRGDITAHLIMLDDINSLEPMIIADSAQAESLLTDLNGWYNELTSASPPSPTRLEEIASNLSGTDTNSLVTSSVTNIRGVSPADTEYNDLVSKRDSAQAALNECQGA